MQCAKLQLQERTKSGVKPNASVEKPRRICQKRLIDPDHEEDQRWTGKALERFYCNENEHCDLNQIYDHGRVQQDAQDLFLSVQNLQFQGEVQQRKRPRTSFKYKTLPGNRKHRMFVKELLEDNSNDGGRFSELTCYYLDDYAKYLLSNDRSRPSTGKSNTFIYTLDNKTKESKAVQTELKHVSRKTSKSDTKFKKPFKRNKDEGKEMVGATKTTIKDAKITYEKSGKRKSLTISRTESPATVQVIRVDVVCNYSSSSTMSDYEDKQTKEENKQEIVNVKQSHFANKYLLTNTVKTLDENAGGARVTLLCKTFKLADRSGILTERKAKSLKNVLRNKSPKRF
ncbi:uncharacterized protein LOC123705472 [Colias croceus]|uniref:uncharacterized protein LOC123705472 n=1 Tax=Colias crocea TaxID=72248 RepID=UPI001E280BA6|nr:uncharacterized protein LOC123705472 [Colias croceus]XP_045510207.1 uncharacterized protein LOC123705472 [Colias croceus]XP_045510209.1 uncharacterized protein LOC123705472 [Colias croceus]